MTLHLPPPLILTFSISFEVPSRIIILFTPFSAAVIAVMKPAAPPPTTAKSKGFKNLLLNILQSDNSKELQRQITPENQKKKNKKTLKLNNNIAAIH